MPKQAPPKPLDLDELEHDYQVMGELAGRQDARQFIAKRRADDMPVLLSVFRTPPGDEGNAISHLASDSKRLADVRNRNLLPVLEGRWVGTDAFAVVTERINNPTLEELLARRDEEFPYARIAMILREVNGVIEWARSQQFVHRAVGLDTVFVEPGDRVLVTFAVKPLSRTGMPGPEGDARNIAQLARAMLTRSPVAPEREERPLAELRPGLPTRIVEDTEKLLQPSRNRHSLPDIGSYIAALAMAEDLKSGEIHLAKSRDAIQEQKRMAHDQLEAERRTHEQKLAAERKAHEQQVADQARRFAKERADFEQKLENERKALAKERETLANERAAHQRDCEALGRERAAHQRDCAALTAERAAHKRDCAILAQERAQYERLSAERRKQLAAATAALAAQARIAGEKAEAARLAALSVDVPDTAPTPPKPPKPQPPPKPPKPSGPKWTEARTNRPRWRSSWNVPAAAVGLLLLIGAFAIAGDYWRDTPSSERALLGSVRLIEPDSGRRPSTPMASSALTIDSVAGAVVSIPDSSLMAASVAPRRDEPPPEPRPEVRPEPRPQTQRFSDAERRDPPQPAPFAGRLDTLIVKIDTIIGGTTVEYRRGGTGRDDLARPRLDTMKRDSLSRIDSMPRRDSTGTLPNYF